MNDMSQAGLVLQGLSAGLQGRGVEFGNSLAERDALAQRGNVAAGKEQRLQAGANQEADLARMKTVFTDSAAGLKFGKDDRWDLVSRIAVNRAESANEQNFPGVDFSGTRRIAQKSILAAQGDKTAQAELLKEFSDNVMMGRELNIFDPEPGPELIKGGDISKAGQVSYMDAKGNLVAKDIKGFKIGDGTDNEKIGASAVTRVYDNGTITQALRNGDTRVTNPEGVIVTGEDRLAVLRAAREEEISFAASKAGRTEAAKSSIKTSDKYFDRIDKIRPAIANIDTAIKAIDDGASTGVFMSMLPSFRAASKELDNVQKRMGLDVIGSTTFGALSAGELALAVSTALPTNMDPAELRGWLVDKKESQQKLSNYIEEAAIFLGTPGGTPAKWAAMQKEKQASAPPAQKGGGSQEGQTATNPQTGEKLIFQGGQWGPA